VTDQRDAVPNLDDDHAELDALAPEPFAVVRDGTELWAARQRPRGAS
jgi:hypothetical protein